VLEALRGCGSEIAGDVVKEDERVGSCLVLARICQWASSSVNSFLIGLPRDPGVPKKRDQVAARGLVVYAWGSVICDTKIRASFEPQIVRLREMIASRGEIVSGVRAHWQQHIVNIRSAALIACNSGPGLTAHDNNKNRLDRIYLCPSARDIHDSSGDQRQDSSKDFP